jgi:hypothetical protein
MTVDNVSRSVFDAGPADSRLRRHRHPRPALPRLLAASTPEKSA